MRSVLPTRTPDGHDLSGEQGRVLEHAATSGRGVEVIRARAGAGKTTIAGLARSEFERHGLRVVGVAPTLQALAELDDVGLEQRETLARTSMADGDFSKIMRTMDHRTVVLVDEAGMSRTKDMAPLLRRAQERGAKVVAIGDDVQLAAVGAGGWFRYLAEHQEVDVLELTEVHRQRDPVERAHLNQMHRGDVAGWTRWAGQHDRIAVTPTVEGAYAEAVRRYVDGLEGTGGDIDRVVVMAPQNSHRRMLNEQLRRVAVDRGVVDRDGQQDFGGLLVAPGERLVATTTVMDPATRRRTVENGERFEVLSVDAAGAQARAAAGGRRGQIVTLPASVLTPAADGRALDHAYARTVHKAQGMTVDRSVLFSPDPTQLGLNLAYVGMTRTRDRADLVTVAPDRATGLDRLVRGMSQRRDHQAALAIIDPDRLNPDRLGGMGDRELDEHRHALVTEAREAMVRLGRLDREARAAWATSGEARTDAHVLAQRDQIAASIDESEQHLAEVDPDGDRQRRGLMEHTIRQGIERDRKTLEGPDQQLKGRGPIDVEAADAEQARIRAEREPVAHYVEGLLTELGDVHALQVDRAKPSAIDPLTVPEHERPSLALQVEAQRAGRVHALNLEAAQQLGTGHPLVAAWVAAGGPGAPAAPATAPAREAPTLTPLQERFAAALDRWDAARGSFADRGGRGQLERLEALQSAMERADQARRAATRALEKHQDGEPSTLRRRAHHAWADSRDGLLHRADVATRTAVEQTSRLQRIETRLGRPVAQELGELRDLADGMTAAVSAAREAERLLLQAGPGGLGERRVARYLGRRDELPAPEQRCYDELASRMAVEVTIATRPTDALGPRWVPVAARPVDRDMAAWRQQHDLPLTPREQSLLERAPVYGDPDHGR